MGTPERAQDRPAADAEVGTITGEVTVKIHAQLVWVNNTNRPPSPAQFTEFGILIV